MCPYNKIGVIEGFLSKEDAFVKVTEYDYKIKKKEVEKIPKEIINVYGTKLLKLIE